MPYRLLTIDLDDTLWPCAPTLAAAEAVFHAWLRRHVPRLAADYDHERLRQHRRLLSAQYPELAHDMTAVRLLSLRRLLPEYGYAPALAETAVAVFRARRNRVLPYPEVAATLRALRRHFLVVSVTNGNAEIAHTPLRGLFDLELTAAAVGAAKPAPALFAQALAWAGVEPEEALHLGDDPLRDIEAARRLGIAAVWVNRSGAAWPTEYVPPQHEVRELRPLYRWLMSGSPGRARVSTALRQSTHRSTAGAEDARLLPSSHRPAGRIIS